jgi:hypothetical protein
MFCFHFQSKITLLYSEVQASGFLIVRSIFFFLQFLVVACLVQYRLPALQKCRTSDRIDNALSEILSFIPELQMTEDSFHCPYFGDCHKSRCFAVPTIKQCTFLLKSDLLLSLRLSCGTTLPGIPRRCNKIIAINYTCPTFSRLWNTNFMFIKFSMHAACPSHTLYEISRHLWHLPID